MAHLVYYPVKSKNLAWTLNIVAMTPAKEIRPLKLVTYTRQRYKGRKLNEDKIGDKGEYIRQRGELNGGIGEENCNP